MLETVKEAFSVEANIVTVSVKLVTKQAATAQQFKKNNTTWIHN